jgi:hypothetical protein
LKTESCLYCLSVFFGKAKEIFPALDVFLLNTLFEGTENQTRLLQSPGDGRRAIILARQSLFKSNPKEKHMAKFSIEVRFMGGLNAAQQAAFSNAAKRWGQVVVGDFPSVTVDGEVIHALVIEASGKNIDGEGSILGQSSPTFLLPNGLPCKGFMEFDIADLAEMEADGTLGSVILHEMGHVLGIGSIWTEMHDLIGAKSANPRFVGSQADVEWVKLSGLAPKSLPVENKGGAGTRNAHWRETVFGNELMTGFLSGATQPLSRMTIASLADLGYKVNFDAADPFSLPSHLELRAMGVGADPDLVRRCTLSSKLTTRLTPKRLSNEALAAHN